MEKIVEKKGLALEELEAQSAGLLPDRVEMRRRRRRRNRRGGGTTANATALNFNLNINESDVEF